MVSPAIVQWHEQLLTTSEPLHLEIGTKIVMGCPLWGEGYTANFLKYCLSSILAPRNRQALDAAGWECVLFVDDVAQQALSGSPFLRLVRLPDDIVALVRAQPEYKYELLTAAHNLLIHKARDIGAGYHMNTADCVYSNAYFESLLRLAKQHDAIADTGLVVSPNAAFPKLDESRRGDGSLDISHGALSFIGRQYMSPSWMAWNMDGITDFEQMPNSHYVHVRGRHSMRVHCAHMNAAWMSNDRCQKVDKHLGGTVDSELPRYMAGSFYTPKVNDGMCAVSFSSEEMPPHGWGPDEIQAVSRCGWEEYKRNFWAFIGGKDDRPRENRFLPYFVNHCTFPLPEDPEAPDDAELDGRLERMMEKLYA